MLFWLDFHQTQSNLYKWFRMQRHDWSSTSPKEPMLHLSSSHCTGYQWQLASSSRHWCLHTERPQAQHPPTSTHYYESTSPPEVWDLLVSDALRYHHREAQNHSPEHSHSPFLDGGIIFPPLSGMLDPCQSSSNNWKLISFGTTWLQPKLVQRKKKKKKLSLYLSLLPLLACTYLNNDWDLVLRALPLSDCLFKMNRFVFPNCKSLWIKASAKWLNVNVNISSRLNSALTISTNSPSLHANKTRQSLVYLNETLVGRSLPLGLLSTLHSDHTRSWISQSLCAIT